MAKDKSIYKKRKSIFTKGKTKKSNLLRRIGLHLSPTQLGGDYRSAWNTQTYAESRLEEYKTDLRNAKRINDKEGIENAKWQIKDEQIRIKKAKKTQKTILKKLSKKMK